MLAAHPAIQDPQYVHQRGTCSYLAPELAHWPLTHTVTQAVDVWSFGIMLVELATVQQPWADNGPEEIYARLQALASLGTGLAPRFEDEEWSFVVERCLQVDPKRRATMPEICTLLERIAAL
ncbi:hypothetical protein CVIRNUC_004033 [Coccomyxa viridis]|uniref:Protein kinase domain-containing protein n=1 Tax=Coccomyxa viridis TaxID=1274662 RepID=A0AAV1I0P4_9CHLO|nr:hypothetical protein CVIRNUC_004033 [Coccomyxa viridis]